MTFSVDIAVERILAALNEPIRVEGQDLLVQASIGIAVRALQDMGVRIALDDFGTGHSTLSLLQDCPVDQLKLDRSFLPHGDTTAIARAVVHVAQVLDLEVVAAGVETSTQANDLYELGYVRAQGFYFARPAPAMVWPVAPAVRCAPHRIGPRGPPAPRRSSCAWRSPS
jgi:EAL domain-containing protein (putative c-di-GMP-specific phosphodiesterase class I)